MPKKRTFSKSPKVPDLLQDPDFRRWYEQLGNGSSSTADAWSRRLRGACETMGTTPGDLLKLDGKALRDLFIDFISSEQKRGKSGPYIGYSLKVVRSWLHFNDREVPSRLKIKDANRVKEESALSRDQLASLLTHADAREKVAISLMAMAGVRPEVLGNFLGTDGLTVGDLPELKFDTRSKTVGLPKGPLRVVVRRDLSKAGHTYFSFLTQEGTGYLKGYLEGRMKTGERLTETSPIITPERAKKPFIRTTNIGDLVRHALRDAGMKDVRPYACRTTFATRLLEAENAGKVPHTFAVFWMGHQGEMTSHYTVNRGKLPEALIEDMRRAYVRCEPILSTVTPPKTSSEDVQREAAILLLMAGHKAKTEEEARKMVEGKSGPELVDLLKAVAPEEKRREKAVPVEEVPKLLEAGWDFVAPLNGSMAVLRAPSGNGGNPGTTG